MKEHLVGLRSDGVVSAHATWLPFSGYVPTRSLSKVHRTRRGASAVARLARSHMLLASACGLWNKAGVGSKPRFTTCQGHGLGVVMDASGQG